MYYIWFLISYIQNVELHKRCGLPEVQGREETDDVLSCQKKEKSKSFIN